MLGVWGSALRDNMWIWIVDVVVRRARVGHLMNEASLGQMIYAVVFLRCCRRWTRISWGTRPECVGWEMLLRSVVAA